MPKKKKSSGSSAAGRRSDDEGDAEGRGSKNAKSLRKKSKDRKSKRSKDKKAASTSDPAPSASKHQQPEKKKRGLFGALSKMRSKRDVDGKQGKSGKHSNIGGSSSNHRHSKQTSRQDDQVMEDDDILEAEESYLPNDPRHSDHGRPPIGVINASQNDDDGIVSEMGEGIADDQHDSDHDHGAHINRNGADVGYDTGTSEEILEDDDIDMDDDIITTPHRKDVCFDNPRHPGTQEWTKIIQQICWHTPKFADTEYSPPIYKAIKKQCKGRRFLVRHNPTTNDAWREATKPEVIEIFGECYNNERSKGSPDEMDSMNGDSSSLNDSAKHSEASLSVGDLIMDKENAKAKTDGKTKPSKDKDKDRQEPKERSTSKRGGRQRNGSKQASPNPPNNDQHKYHQQQAQRKNKLTGRQSTTSPQTMESGDTSPVSISPTQSCEDLADPLLQSCIEHCRRAQELGSPYASDISKVNRGRLVEHKMEILNTIISRSPQIRSMQHPNSNVTQLHSQLQALQETILKIQYANLASLLQPIEQMEHELQDYFQVLINSSSSKSLEISLQQLTQSMGATTTGGMGQGSTDHSKSASRAKHLRSIPIMSEHNQAADTRRKATKQDPTGNKAAFKESNHNNDIENGHVNRDSSKKQLQQQQDVSEYDEVEMTESNNCDDDIDEEFLLQEDDVNEIESLENGPGGSFAEPDDGAMPEGFEGSYNMNEGLNLKLNSSDDLENSHVLELHHSPDDDMSSVGRSTRGYDFGSQGFDYRGDDDDEDRYEHHNTGTSEDDDDDEDYEEEEVMEGEEDEMLNGTDEDDSSRTSSSSSTDENEKRRSGGNKKKKGGDDNAEAPINPKVEHFFDRLNHFFEVRRKVEERAQLMDPSSKIENLKLKLHSGGIARNKTKFKKEYQQHDLEDRVVQNLDDLYEAAQQAHPALKRVLDQLACEVKGLDITSCILSSLKPRPRAYEKAREEYIDRVPGPSESWLYDIVRCSVICKSYKQMSDVNKWLGKKVHIVRCKNRFAQPAFNGYRDFLYHVSIPYQDELAHICEIQVHHKDMKALDDQFGLPKHLEFFRSAFANSNRDKEKTLKDLKLLNKYGTMEGPLLAKVMRSKDCEQLNLFAGICREKLNEFDRALELYRRLLMMQEDSVGREHEDVASTYLNIGLVLGMMGETDESLLNLQKALAIQEMVLGAEHLKVAESYREIGHMLSKKGDFDGALEQQRKALRIRQNLLGNQHFLVINSLQDIGHSYRDQGDYKAAVSEYNKALLIQADVLGPQHTDVASTHAMMGNVLCLQGEYDRAMDEHRRALDIREAGMGKNHPMTAKSHTDIGIVQYYKGDYEVAEWRHRKALRIREAILGKDHEVCASSYSKLGEVLCKKGHYQKALKEVHRGLTIRENTLSRDHPMTACSFIDIGDIHMVTGDYEDALQEYRRAMVIRESILGDQHPDTAAAYTAVSLAMSKKGDHKAALAQSHRAVEILENVLGKSHPKTAAGYASLADALMAKGDKDQALTEHRKALALRANVLSKDHPDTASSCASIGRLLLDKGDIVGAAVAFGQALAIQNALCGDDHPETATARLNMGRVYVAKREFDDALDAMQTAVVIQLASFGKQHFMTAIAYSLLGSIHSMMENYEQAQTEHQRACEIREAVLGAKNKMTLLSKKKLQMAIDEETEEELEAPSS